MHKSLAVFAVALGVIAISAGSAFAEGDRSGGGGGCGYDGTQSVSLENQTASTGPTGEQTPYTPVPETSSN